MSEDRLTELVRNADITKLIHFLDQDINQANERGDTALLIATRLNNRFLVDQLITLGADLNHENKRGTSALTLAIFNGFFEIAKDLWMSGAKLIRPIDKEGDRFNLVHTATYKRNLKKLEDFARGKEKNRTM